ncbi:U3 small nucleolar RNA-associated protein 5 [Leucoagaricus sp. SymC.cos]|nr:U3 small nucleolar RNA-associated protein 5 [Leucoagaricus sp. SymC.cos]
MAATKKSKKAPKPPQGRPASTTPISQPAVEDTSSLFAISSFSARGNLFAYISLAVDKHRLRIYSTTSGQAIADCIVEHARVSSLAWAMLELGEADESEDTQPTKKKRKKDNHIISESRTKPTEVVVLGLSDGSILCFSPSHGRILRTLSHSSSKSAILALAIEDCHMRSLIWTSGQDITLRLWDASKNELIGSWKNDDRIPYTSLTVCSPNGKNRAGILSASHRIRLLSSSQEADGSLPKKLSEMTTFTGHASPVKSMKWDRSDTLHTRFISMAETDRFLYLWDIPDSPASEASATASIPLDSDVRSFSLISAPDSYNTSILLTLSASGRIALFPIPQQITAPTDSSRSPAKLPTLHSRSTIIPTPKKSSIPAPVINVSFVDGEEGCIRVVRLVQGVRPVFTITRYLDEAGQFIDNSQLGDVPEAFLKERQPRIFNKRYNESSVTVGSGIELGHDANLDETTVRDIDGDLEVDLAELSLGQRLGALANVGVHRSSESENEGNNPLKSQPFQKKPKSELDIIPANSLTRTLIQALHSSDTKLIETCLTHSNPDLIRNTVKSLPPQLAIPLLNACVERLGRGARAANMKGGGAGTSAQRGMTLINWIRTILAVHTGHLMTVPDLVARLSGLHATLTARLALQESLLSLSGRLDMVLSQIEMRSSAAPTSLAPKHGKASSAAQEKPVKRYVEGESDSSDDELNAQMDVEIEIGDDEGSVEDVELGRDSEGEEDEVEEVGDEDEGSDASSINEFIDDETEEYSEEEDESE